MRQTQCLNQYLLPAAEDSCCRWQTLIERDGFQASSYIFHHAYTFLGAHRPQMVWEWSLQTLHCGGRRGAYEPVERKQKRLTGQTPTFINKIRFEVALYKLLLLYRSINVVIGVWCICRLNWFNVVLEAKVLNEHGFGLSVWTHPVCPFTIFTSLSQDCTGQG